MDFSNQKHYKTEPFEIKEEWQNEIYSSPQTKEQEEEPKKKRKIKVNEGSAQKSLIFHFDSHYQNKIPTMPIERTEVVEDKKRQSHSEIEKRRRNHIADCIQNLFDLLPEWKKRQSVKPNKGVILESVAEYITELKNENQKLRVALELCNVNPDEVAQNSTTRTYSSDSDIPNHPMSNEEEFSASPPIGHEGNEIFDNFDINDSFSYDALRLFMGALAISVVFFSPFDRQETTEGVGRTLSQHSLRQGIANLNFFSMILRLFACFLIFAVGKTIQRGSVGDQTIKRVSYLKELAEKSANNGNYLEAENKLRECLFLLHRPIPSTSFGLFTCSTFLCLTQILKMMVVKRFFESLIYRALGVNEEKHNKMNFELLSIYQSLNQIIGFRPICDRWLVVYCALNVIDLAERYEDNEIVLVEVYCHLSDILRSHSWFPVSTLAKFFTILARWRTTRIYGKSFSRSIDIGILLKAQGYQQLLNGDLSNSISSFNKARESLSSAGSPYHLIECTITEGFMLACFANRPWDAVRVFQGMENFSQHNPNFKWWSLIGQSFVLLRLGQLDQVSQLLEDVESLSLTTVTTLQSAFLLAISSCLNLRRGKRHHALQLANAAGHLLSLESVSNYMSNEVHVAKLCADTHFSLIDHYLSENPANIQDITRQILVLAHNDLDLISKFSRVSPLFTPINLFYQGRLHKVIGDLSKAESLFNDSRLNARHMKLIYDEGMALYELARCNQNPKERQELLYYAKDLFLKTEYPYELIMIEQEISSPSSDPCSDLVVSQMRSLSSV